MGNTKGEGLFCNVFIMSQKTLVYYLTSINIYCFFFCHETFRVWPNTAGVISALKVGHLHLCHLVR